MWRTRVCGRGTDKVRRTGNTRAQGTSHTDTSHANRGWVVINEGAREEYLLSSLRAAAGSAGPTASSSLRRRCSAAGPAPAATRPTRRWKTRPSNLSHPSRAAVASTSPSCAPCLLLRRRRGSPWAMRAAGGTPPARAASRSHGVRVPKLCLCLLSATPTAGRALRRQALRRKMVRRPARWSRSAGRAGVIVRTKPRAASSLLARAQV